MDDQLINRGDLFWIAPDDSRGPAPSYSHPHIVVQEVVAHHDRGRLRADDEPREGELLSTMARAARRRLST